MLKRTKCIVIRIIEVLLVLSAILAAGLFFYFNVYRDTIFHYPPQLTQAVATEIDLALSKVDIANGIQVMKVDLKRNAGYIIHTHWKTSELQKLFSHLDRTGITAEIPVFSKDDVQNARIVRLMNHEFDCVAFKDALSYRLVPESEHHITTVCSISIPPAFSEFKGIVAVSLSKVPTRDEREILKIMLIGMSDRIYAEIK